MTYMRVNKTFHFEAAHRLPYHRGKCQYNHGHSYKVELCVGGDIQADESTNPEAGMVVDFSVLSEWWRWLDAKYGVDHITTLNDLLTNPTAERICEWIVKAFESDVVMKNMALLRVRVHETADSYVEWNFDDQRSI
jgi:6-pyruvoyltetrahydropterin/6-carboxytetrahydropterin synthase